jgi:hypothetical protein
VYRQNVTDFLRQLGRYTGLALYPERPQGWFGNERFKDAPVQIDVVLDADL